MTEVPIHAWKRDMFTLLSNSFGRFIKLDPLTENKQRLDIARIYVRTSNPEFINRIFNIHINNESFNIRITEEICDYSYREIERINLEWPNQGKEDDDEDSESSFIPPSMADMEDEEEREREREKLVNNDDHF